MSHYLGYPPGSDKPTHAANHRNTSAKTVLTERGPVRIEGQRDREG